MNVSARNKSLEPKRKPKKATQAQAKGSSSISESSDRPSGSGPSDLVIPYRNLGDSTKNLAPPMPTDWHQQALCQFFYDYIIPADDKGRAGSMTFLPDLYQQNQGIPFLVESVDAVSMASLAGRNSMSHLMMRARRAYGKAINFVNMALNHEEQKISDELQVSVMLLTMYEVMVITGDKDSLMGSHGAGLVHLIRLRGEEQFKSNTGCEIYTIVRSRDIWTQYAPQSLPGVALEAPLKDLDKKPHRAQISNWLSRISALCGAVSQNVRGASGRTLFPKGWDIEVLALEEELQQWNEHHPEFFRYWSLSPYDATGVTDPEDGPIYPKAIYFCSSLLLTQFWSLIWCGRVHLLHAMLVYRSTLSEREARESPLPAVSSIKQDLLTLVDHICNFVPFLLGEIDHRGALTAPGRGRAVGAIFAMWVLHVASSVSITPQLQQEWIACRLLYIGHAVGIQQALVLKDFRDFQRRTSPGMPLSMERTSA
ncbi:MAG: hypothetical protein Q9195_006036 [Heterodermia aff. obscurata]